MMYKGYNGQIKTSKHFYLRVDTPPGGIGK